jgi:NADP-dependent 3-hydroxy acid dehydrogenase YdfG
MLGLNPEKVAKAADKLAAHGDYVHALVADVTKQEQWRRRLRGRQQRLVGLTCFLTMLALAAPCRTSGSSEIRKRALRPGKISLTSIYGGVIYGVHAALPIMLEQGSGHIVNTSSIAGIIPAPMQALYNTTKYGVTALTESLRYEYAEKGLYFSTICPSEIATPI